MGERTQPDLTAARDALRAGPEAMPIEDRKGLVRAVAEVILCRGAPEVAVVEVLELLAGDADWSVRLEVARILHLLDDEACSRLAAVFRQDCNRYVRSHVERSLSRQRKARRSSNRQRSERRGYADQLDELTRQYGKRVAAKVQTLADQRFAMLAVAVTHDVRRILTTLSANVAALDKDHDRTASIVEDVTFLRHTVDAMEQFSTPLPEQRHPEDLAQMVRQAIDKAWACVSEQGHDPKAVEMVVADIPTIRPRVARRLIVLALTNVIQNALESFAERDVDALRPGKIEVRVVVDGYETRIFIQDNGSGLEPEVLSRLRQFVPTGPNRYKRSSSGWGLSLAHKYITAHGGDVAIDSELDQGTTVVLTLPMRDATEGDDHEGAGG